MTKGFKGDYFSKMVLYRTVISMAAVTLVLAGCAGLSQEDRRDFDLLKKRVSALQESRITNEAKIDELNNKIILLNEKIEAKRGAEGAGGESGPAAGYLPPEGLKVVSLGAQEDAVVITSPPPPPGQVIVRPSTIRSKPPVKPEPAPRSTAARDQMQTTAVSTGPVTPEVLYSKGRDEFLSGLYSSARLTFTRLETEYPGHQLADNALYWVGESFYTQKEFEKALEFFDKTADKYPEGNKAPDALLKAGYSCIELGRAADAELRLRAVLDRYPGTEAASKAASRLATLD